MFPIIQVGPAALQAPGLILLIGYWLSLNLAGRRAKAEGLGEDAVVNAGFIALLVGLIGARLGYVALYWSAYQNDLPGIFGLSANALSTPAGVLSGVVAASLYLRRYRFSTPILLDALAPALALLLAFSSLADLSSGSAYGSVTNLPWAIELWGARRHPTQIYELLAALATLAAVWWMSSRRPYTGFLFLLFVLVYSSLRVFLEAFRDAPWLLLGGYRTVQVIGLGAMIVSLWVMSRRSLEIYHT